MMLMQIGEDQATYHYRGYTWCPFSRPSDGEL